MSQQHRTGPAGLSSETFHPILAPMAIILLLIFLGAEGDYDPARTYEFIEKGNGPVEKRQVFGRILEKRPDGWLVEIDAPWENRRVVPLVDDMLESGPLLETEAMREKRIEKGWKDRGFTKITTANGKNAFVASREAELAERAREAAPSPPGPFPIPEQARQALEKPLPDASAQSQLAAPGFPWPKRLAQAVLLVVALTLAFIIARTTFLSEN